MHFLPGPAAAEPPFGIGDWNITDEVELAGTMVLIDGNVTVLPGGSLTLRNTTMQMYSDFEGEHELRVKGGGTIRVLDRSTVAAFDALRHSGFWIERGARAELSNSTFIAAGLQERAWWPPYDPEDPADLMTSVGGVVVMTADANINNCTFTEAPIALSFFHTNGKVRDCLFTKNYFGLLSHTSNTTIQNCTFSRNVRGHLGGGTMGAAAWSYRSRTLVEDCTFTENNIGVCPDTTDCVIRNCSFQNGSGEGGVFMSGLMGYEVSGSSNTTIEDCEFSGNFYGIANEPSQGTQNLGLRNCVFRDNSKMGIWWDNRRPAINSELYPAPNARWLVDGRCELVNDTFDFNGSIVVAEGGSLHLDGATLQVDSDRPGENGILVRPGATLAAERSVIEAFPRGAPYSLQCLPGSAVRLDNTTVRGSGWNGTAVNTSGPYIAGTGATVRGCVLERCPVGLVFDGAVDAVVEGTTIEGLELAMMLLNSTVGLLNSTVRPSGGPNITLGAGSRLVCINTTRPGGALVFTDGASSAEIGWYLEVRARWSDGSPAGGAAVTVEDSGGRPVANGTAAPDGRLSGIVAWEAALSAAGRTDRTPHKVRCALDGVENGTALTVDRSRSVTVELHDGAAPFITVLRPATGSVLPTASVPCVGFVEDNVALQTVELSVDSLRGSVLYRRAGAPVKRFDWNLTLAVGDGAHRLELRALDSAGNGALAVVTFGTDTTAPFVLVTSPYDGFLTSERMLGVAGLMEPGSAVLVNGQAARTTGRNFTAEVPLSEGENLIEAEATDGAGNTNRSSILVRLDTVPPALSVDISPAGPFVNTDEVKVSGTMEQGAAVWVNGRPVVLPGLSDNFTTSVVLRPGENTITVQAYDAAGNVNLSSRTLMLDLIPPALAVVFPPEGHMTREPRLTVSVAAEAGCTLSTGNETLPVPGEPGAAAMLDIFVNLTEGANTIALVERDASGNVQRAVVHVTLDTAPPALGLLSPSDGNRTREGSVYVVGTTEPGASVTVNGLAFEVGYGGSFSGELRLAAGTNRIVVRAQDPAGNSRELSLNVTRLPADGETAVATSQGPDWPFWGFLAVAAVAASGEGWWLWRRQSRRPLPPSTLAPLPPAQSGKEEVG